MADGVNLIADFFESVAVLLDGFGLELELGGDDVDAVELVAGVFDIRFGGGE